MLGAPKIEVLPYLFFRQSRVALFKLQENGQEDIPRLERKAAIAEIKLADAEFPYVAIAQQGQTYRPLQDSLTVRSGIHPDRSADRARNTGDEPYPAKPVFLPESDDIEILCPCFGQHPPIT